MDNDTLNLTCERVEDELSGYLDNVLDPRLRQAVDAHLATCAHCQEILADFQRSDGMLRALPFIEPPPGMREAFFNSPRYLELTKAHSRRRSFITPLTGTLVAAAMVVLALGGALLFRQGVFGAQQASVSPTTSTIGNIGGDTTIPLAAGSRLIYQRAGALWSAPESGNGVPRQLTHAGITVAAWSVSPNGRTVIYIDAQTGALHAVRADGLKDAVIGAVTSAKTTPASFWATPTGNAIAHGIAWSPDNTRLAYLAQSTGGLALHVMNATGAADVVARAADGSQIGQPLWSGDSIYVAYTLTQAGTQSVAVYNVTTGHAQTVAAHADGNNAAAVVGQMGWLPTSSAITWSAVQNGTVTSIFRADVATSNSTVRLTAIGARYAAADLAVTGNWLLAHGTTLSAIASGANFPQVVATFASPITELRAGPSGQASAVIAGGTLTLLLPDHSVVTVAQGMAAQGMAARTPLAWSTDGGALAWQSGNTVRSVQVHAGVVGAAKTLAEGGAATALVWSPDAGSLAVVSDAGVAVVTADGAQVRASDAHATNGGQIAWSYAG